MSSQKSDRIKVPSLGEHSRARVGETVTTEAREQGKSMKTLDYHISVNFLLKE